MEIKINSNTFFIFDLDDTLFEEIDYLKSAYLHISSKITGVDTQEVYKQMFRRYQENENVFQWLLNEFKRNQPELSLEWLLQEYREHMPSINLSKSTAGFLHRVGQLKIPSGLITDGRSLTQRNKLKALGIDDYFKDIIISEEFGSEKPDEKNYLYFQEKYPEANFYFFGDNTAKDFIVPEKLGWRTICLKSAGNNIHKQILTTDRAPDHVISSFDEITLLETW